MSLVGCAFVNHVVLQEIDALLAGGLTQEDEADVLNELDQILLVVHLWFSLKYQNLLISYLCWCTLHKFMKTFPLMNGG